MISLTNLDNYDGFPEQDRSTPNIHASEIVPIKEYVPYYRYTIKKFDSKPWIGQRMEDTFMNNYRGVPQPETYKELRFGYVDPITNKNSSNLGLFEHDYDSIEYDDQIIEQFEQSYDGYKSGLYACIMMLILLFVIYLVMKNY